MKVWPPDPQRAEQFNGSVAEDVHHFPSEAAEDPCLYEASTLGRMNHIKKYNYFTDQWSS